MSLLLFFLENSIKYSYKNSIYVKVELDDLQSNLKISVSDSGSGLSNEEKTNCLNTFQTETYSSINFDPYNIGCDIFTCHLLAVLLSPPKSEIKGLTLISEEGYGSSFSFLVKDFEDFENLKDIEDNPGQIISKMKNLSYNSFSENKFLSDASKKNQDAVNFISYNANNNLTNQISTKNKTNKDIQEENRTDLLQKLEKSNKINYDLSFEKNSSKSKLPSQTVILNSNVLKFELIRVNSTSAPNEDNKDQNTKSKKYTFNEFSKNDTNTFSFVPSQMNIEDELASHKAYIQPPTKSKMLDARFLENDISSICCSKLGSDIVWSFSSDSQILKELSDFNIFEDKLRQIKEINKYKKCSCSDILICDFDVLSNYAIKNVLLTLGFIAESTSISSEAISKVKKKLESTCCTFYKMIFIFNKMPSLSGKEVCKLIQKEYLEKNVNCPALIALANRLNEKQQTNLEKCGFADFICKPILQNTLNFYIKKFMVVDLIKKKIMIA